MPNSAIQPNEPIRPEPEQMADAPRCLARTRSGAPCRGPAVRGRPRCRLHGCAPGSGGQPGNTNALRHGARSREYQAARAMLRKMSGEVAGSGRR